MLKLFDVQTTLTCEEGLNTFYSFKPNLVLLDVNVGSSDGRLLCKTIKDQLKYKIIPVILMSASHLMLLSYAHYSASAVIEKPFDLADLHKTVQLHLNN